MRKSKNLLVLDSSIGKVSRRRTSYVSADYTRRRTVLILTGAVLSVVVLLLAIWGVVAVFADIMEPDKQPLISVAPEAASYGDADALTVLVIKTDDDDLPDKCVLLRFEPSEERVYVTGVSGTAVFDGKSLYDHFSEGGSAQCGSAIARTVDCDQVYTVVIDYTQTRLLINDLGGVTVTVPYAINYDSPSDDRNIIVAAGTREFTGGEVARLLNYPNWEGGESEHLAMYSQVLGNLISDQLTPSTQSDDIKDFYLSVYSNAAFDMPMNTYQMALSGMLYLASTNEGDLVMQVDIEAAEQSDGTRTYSADDLALLQAVYGRRTVQD